MTKLKSIFKTCVWLDSSSVQYSDKPIKIKLNQWDEILFFYVYDYEFNFNLNSWGTRIGHTFDLAI